MEKSCLMLPKLWLDRQDGSACKSTGHTSLDDLSWSPGTHVVEGENDSPPEVILQACHGTCVPTLSHRQHTIKRLIKTQVIATQPSTVAQSYNPKMGSREKRTRSLTHPRQYCKFEASPEYMRVCF